MHPSTPLPQQQQQQQQLDRLARHIELAAFDEESVAVMAVIEYVISNVSFSVFFRDKALVIFSQKRERERESRR
jgi:hypothetical protein